MKRPRLGGSVSGFLCKFNHLHVAMTHFGFHCSRILYNHILYLKMKTVVRVGVWPAGMFLVSIRESRFESNPAPRGVCIMHTLVGSRHLLRLLGPWDPRWRPGLNF